MASLATPSFFTSLSDDLLLKIASFTIGCPPPGTDNSTAIQFNLCLLASEGSHFQSVTRELVRTLVLQDDNDISFVDLSPIEPERIDFFSRSTKDELRERILKCLGNSFDTIHVNHVKDNVFPHGIARYCTSVTKLEVEWATNNDAVQSIIDDLLPTLGGSIEDLRITCRYSYLHSGRRSVLCNVIRHLQYGPCSLKVLYFDYDFLTPLSSLWSKLGGTLKEVMLRSPTKSGWNDTIDKVVRFCRGLVKISFVGAHLPGKKFIDMLVTYGALLEETFIQVIEISECVRLVTRCPNVQVTAVSYSSDIEQLVGLCGRLNRLKVGMGLTNKKIDQDSISKICTHLPRLELIGHCTEISLNSIFSHSFNALHDLQIYDSSLILRCGSIRSIASATGNLCTFYHAISTVHNSYRFESIARANPHLREVHLCVALCSARCATHAICARRGHTFVALGLVRSFAFCKQLTNMTVMDSIEPTMNGGVCSFDPSALLSTECLIFRRRCVQVTLFGSSLRPGRGLN